jgi:hypothetical protein
MWLNKVLSSRWTYLAFACINTALAVYTWRRHDWITMGVDVVGTLGAIWLFFRLPTNK